MWRSRIACCVVWSVAGCSDSADPAADASTSEASTSGSGAGGFAGSTSSSAGTGGGDGGSGGAGVSGGAGGAAPSTVELIPDCTGVTDIAVELSTTDSNEFTIDGVVGFSFALVSGDVVRFSTASDHNFESVPGTPPAFFFKSGPAGPHTACLRFTAPAPEPFGFECDPHAGDGMVGTLTVD